MLPMVLLSFSIAAGLTWAGRRPGGCKKVGVDFVREISGFLGKKNVV